MCASAGRSRGSARWRYESPPPTTTAAPSSAPPAPTNTSASNSKRCWSVSSASTASRTASQSAKCWSLTLGEHPAHPERHTGHVRAGRDLLTYDWYIAATTDDVVTVLVDWRPLALIEQGRYRHHCTISLYPPFRAALTTQQASVPAKTLSLRDRHHHNPEGNLPSLADKARMRIAVARAPHEAARRHAARKGWLAVAGDRLELTARELLKLAGVNLNRIAKRGRSASWFDTLARFMPSRARKAAPQTPLLDTRLSIDTPAAPVPTRPGPARASPTPAFS